MWFLLKRNRHFIQLQSVILFVQTLLRYEQMYRNAKSPQGMYLAVLRLFLGKNTLCVDYAPKSKITMSHGVLCKS